MGVFTIYLVVKRVFDIVFSLLAIVVLVPFLILISVAIKADSKGPVLFRQVRVGRYKSLFYILKFRTMKMNAPKDTPTHMLAGPDTYITRVGRFLRNTSFDELPQIFNIFLGQMSIVGPRPALWNQYDLIDERDQYGANDIRPGLTGWAQINGRDELSIATKARLDGEYTKKIGLRMDLRCILGTIGKVIKRDGIVEGNSPVLQEEVEMHKETKAI